METTPGCSIQDPSKLSSLVIFCLLSYFYCLANKRTTEACTKEAESVTARQIAAMNSGTPLYGVEVPNCDVDGMYAGMQFIGSQ